MAQFDLSLRDGLVDAEMEPWQAAGLSMAVQKRIRKLVPVLDDHLGEAGYARVHRLARMGYELTKRGRLTGLSREDLDELSDLPVESGTDFMFGRLSKARSWPVLRCGDLALECDEYAKSVAATMAG